MEWFRRRKSKKNFKKTKEAYDLGYRHAREDMQEELDDLQKQTTEASEREEQLLREIGLLRKRMVIERREHRNTLVTVTKQFTKAYYKLKVKCNQLKEKSPSSPLPLSAHKSTGHVVIKETDTTASPRQHMQQLLVKEEVHVPPQPGFETAAPQTPPGEKSEADGVELQGSPPLPETAAEEMVLSPT